MIVPMNRGSSSFSFLRPFFLKRPALALSSFLMLSALGGLAQQSAPVPPQTDSSSIDADGTARITRVVPVPKTISPQAQAMLARRVSDASVPQTLAQRRSGTDAWQGPRRRGVEGGVSGDCQRRRHRRDSPPHRRSARQRPSGSRADQPARRRLQLRFRLADGVDPHCEPHSDEGRGCALSPGARASLSGWSRRCGRRVRRAFEELQARAHSDLRHLGRGRSSPARSPCGSSNSGFRFPGRWVSSPAWETLLCLATPSRCMR